MDYDAALRQVGDFGPYQLIVCLSVMYYQANHGMQNAVVNFISAHQRHWCKVDAVQNLTEQQQKYIAIPYSDGERLHDSCSYFDLPWTNFTQDDFETWNRTAMTDGVGGRKCTQWVYDYSEYDATISSEVRYMIS